MARRRQDHDHEEAARYGFRWGQLDVIRNAEFLGRKSLSILTDSQEIEIAVSAKGQRIRVYRNGKELT